MAEEHKVKAVLNIGGEIGETLKSSLELLTGNISKIGEVSNKAIKHQLGDSISAAKDKVKDLTAQIKKTGDATGALAREQARYNRELEIAKGANSLFYAAESSTAKFARGLAVVTAEAAATGFAIFKMTEHYEDFVKQSYRGGATLDLTPARFAALNFAAGDQTEDVQKAFGFFKKNFLNGNKKALSSLAELGISPKDLNGSNALDSFLKLGDALNNFHGDKTTAAKNILGKSGASALPFLLRGSEVNKEKMEDVKKLGIAPTEEDIKQNLEYADAMEKMEVASTSVRFAIGKALLPAVEQLGETLLQFTLKHHDDLVRWATDLGQAVKGALPTLGGLEQAILKVGAVIDFFGRHSTLAKIALIAFITVPFLPFIASIRTLAIAIKQLGGAAVISAIGSGTKALWGLAAAELPLVAMTATIIGLAAAFALLGKDIYDVYQNWDILSNSDGWKGMAKNLFDPSSAKTSKRETDSEIFAHRKNLSPSEKPSTGAVHGRRGNATTNHVTINVHPSPGMDEHALARRVASVMDRALTGGGALYDGHFA